MDKKYTIVYMNNQQDMRRSIMAPKMMTFEDIKRQFSIKSKCIELQYMYKV